MINYNIIYNIASSVANKEKLTPSQKNWLVSYHINKKELLSKCDNDVYSICDFIENKIKLENNKINTLKNKINSIKLALA